MNTTKDTISNALDALHHFGRNMEGGALLLRHVETLGDVFEGLESKKHIIALEIAALAECVRAHPEMSRDWHDQLINLSKRLGFRHEDQNAQHEAIDF